MADWSDLIGLTLEEAQRKAAQYDYKIRVTSWNGKPALTTRDYRPDRINVAVTRNPTTVEGSWRVESVSGQG